MKHLLSSCISIITAIALSFVPSSVQAQQAGDSSGEAPMAECDSTRLVALASGEANNSFFKGVIPPSPNAAALARYAEYQVSHATGVPDITIPLYEIDLGGYSLPISISYHASGCRVDDVPTSVGQGWCLNAGGAVTRTVLGAPDLWMDSGGMTDDRYLDPDALAGLVERGASNSGARDTIRSILDGSRMLDTESDRYSYNVAGATGVFRYSYKNEDYVVLSHNNNRITSYGAGILSRFVISDPSGIKYHLGTQELSGVNYRDESYSHTSAWYVDSITTPYGCIRFSYRKSARSFNVNRHSTTTEAGFFPQYDGEGESPPKYEIRDHSGTSSVVHDQVLLEEIEWNGNRVRFEYGCDNPGYTPYHIMSMTVADYNGATLKTVGFTHTMWEPTNGYGRRMLTSLEDSSQGTFSFTYNGTARTRIPSWNFGADSATCSDLWGFYNGYTRDVHVLPEETIDELTRNFQGVKQDHVSFSGRSRSPSLEHTLLGVLESVTFPTGGSASYAYELSKVTVGSGAYTAGGLRVKSVTVHDGTTSYVKTYQYSGVLSQDPPESRMVHRTYIKWSNVPPLERGMTYLYEYKTAGSYPVDYTFSASSPVAYTSVVERRHDGSYTTFTYDCSDIIDVSGVRGYDHPSIYGVSLHDPGAREPRLRIRTVSDSNGRDVFRETNTYVRINVDEAVPTGSRIYSNFINADFQLGDRWIGAESDLTDEKHLFLRTTTACAGACLLSEHTETDLTTGFTTTTSYTYDTSSGTLLRTTNPRSTAVTDSRGNTVTTTYTYPFERTDAMCKGMTDLGQTDAVVAVRVTGPDRKVLSGTDTEYALFNGMYYPVATRSWSMPTSDVAVTVPSTLPERERVASYNVHGRPTSITVNATDVTSFTWDSHGQLLSSTAPGGLTTAYTHRPLFGVASVTAPNGHRDSYTYNASGMLSTVGDNPGTTATYSYSIANHPRSDMSSDGNSVTSRRHLTADGLTRTFDRQYHDALGRPSVLAKAGMNTSGKYLYTATTYDRLGRELRSIMPCVGVTDIERKSASQVLSSATSTHGDSYAYSETSYDALDRPVRVTTPGKAWNDAGKWKTTEYVGNGANSVRCYQAPMTSLSLVEEGYYAASTLQGVRSIDEDGNEMTVYTDRLGRKILERRGPEKEKGQNDTYFVYNDLGQLRFVLSPGYELSGYRAKFAYEYRYDEHGNIVKKFIPGGGYTQYWYDRAGRMTFMQDPNLREQGLHRFFLYDMAGRQAIQGVSKTATAVRQSTSPPTPEAHRDSSQPATRLRMHRGYSR
ncbi:MAG: DUF6443 domain-containing protein [Muribaculum sp.]|nr:DUF6443 domain-containing protein [Muribaculum sp.]